MILGHIFPVEGCEKPLACLCRFPKLITLGRKNREGLLHQIGGIVGIAREL